jgi:heterodisulfide reductase subunit A-like polyferredoxin
VNGANNPGKPGAKTRKNEGENLRILVDADACRLSRECMKVCPHDAIYVKGGSAVIDQEKCDQDGICIAACPNGAIHFATD